MTRLFVSLGRSAGVRPQDLVGAITGETELAGRDVGTIEITDRFSLVEVPEQAADSVIAALGSSRIKGNRATVRRDAERRPFGAGCGLPRRDRGPGGVAGATTRGVGRVHVH